MARLESSNLGAYSNGYCQYNVPNEKFSNKRIVQVKSMPDKFVDTPQGPRPRLDAVLSSNDEHEDAHLLDVMGANRLDYYDMVFDTNYKYGVKEYDNATPFEDY